MRGDFGRMGAVLFLSVAAVFAAGQTTIHLNWTNSDARFDTCWTNAGYTAPQALTASEKNQIRDGIRAELGVIYAGFQTTFQDNLPGSGNFHRLTYGNTTTSTGLFGQAVRLDWRNPNKNDNADVYIANFGQLLSASSFDRATNITRLIHALAGTSAHELGHNLGLQHYDDYGDPGINPATYTNTGGLQNLHIMATGATGLSATGRTTLRSFSQLEKVKLEYADGIAPVLGTTVNETAGVHNTRLTSQALVGTILPLSGVSAINVAGNLAASTEDWYSFTGTPGSLFTANILASDVGLSSLNSILTLYDSGGVQLRTNNNITFSGNTIFGTGTYGNDPMLLNVPLTAAGTYYVRVSGSGTSSGNYNLLMTGIQAVPEPASLLALGSAALVLLRRRNKKA